VIEASYAEKQTTLLVRSEEPILDPAWAVTPVTLDDIVLGYMRQGRAGAPAAPKSLAVTS
jgi:ABC-2 type transport system ATP-binding protein